jgi:hypothetical protein
MEQEDTGGQGYSGYDSTHRRGAVAVPELEMSHPKTVISVTTKIPNQTLR